MPAKIKAVVRPDTDGHWVDWSKDDANGSLGPY